jgi:hypothetical protein
MINALAGARFLETGVCRTTRVPCVLSSEDPGRNDIVAVGAGGLQCDWKRADMKSDDGVSLCVVDLPGICDAENTGAESNFTELTVKWAASCDVIMWVTDVRTCFLTSHEKLEYEKLKAVLQREADKNGRLFQFCIVLAKCDWEVSAAGAAPRSSAVSRNFVQGEITTDHEDTTVADCVDRAKRLFPDDLIVQFNAFGRILTRGGSEALRALASRIAPGSTKVNAGFSLKWATEDLHEKRQAQLLRSIVAALAEDPVTKGPVMDPNWASNPSNPYRAQYGKSSPCIPSSKAPRSSEATANVRTLVDGIDENTTALLLCLVIGATPHSATCHPIVAAVGKNAPLVPKNAELIGFMKHGPSAAKTQELAIKKRLELTNRIEHNTKAKYDDSASCIVEAMMHMCGPSCIVTTRMFLSLPLGSGSSAGLLCAPSAMKAVPPGYPSLLKLDVQHNENRAVGAHLSWVKKVREARMSLWGDAERDVCVPTVIALVREKIMPSVLSPIGT